MAKVYSIRRAPFIKPEDLESFFADIDTTKVSHVSPDNPKGGEVYVFYTPNEGDSWNKDVNDYWKNDGRKWTNYGLKKMPRAAPFLYKTYHAAKVTGGVDPRFVRHGYAYIDKSVPYTVVHYLGDETLTFSDAKMGIRGARRNKRKANDTDSETSLLDISTVSEAGDAAVAEDTKNTPELLQTMLLLKKHKTANVSVKKFITLSEISQMLPGFIKELSLSPEVFCLMSYDSLTSTVLAVMNNEEERRNAHLIFVTSNQKTWDFYVSYYMVHHSRFPFPVPLLVAVHEKRTLHVNDVMMRSILEHLPWANDLKLSISTDIERFYTFCNPLPSRLKSWTSILDDVIRVLRENNTNAIASLPYVEDIMVLVSCTSNDEFGSQLKQKIIQWGKRNCTNDYLQRCLVNIFEKHAKQWGADAEKEAASSNEGNDSPFKEINNMINGSDINIEDIVYRVYFLQCYFTSEAKELITPPNPEVQVLYLPEDMDKS